MKGTRTFIAVNLVVLALALSAQAASLPGTATVSGIVDSSKPFKAAQVYFSNPALRMLYMVYTVAGKYEASQLFPGDYEVSVATKGLQNLASDVSKITLKAGQRATMNLSMHEVPAGQKQIEYLPFNEIYPQGRGRAVLQRTCVYCHGENFLPSKHWNEKQWNAAIDMMTANGNANTAMIQPKDMNAQDRADALAYLVANFGPDSKERSVKVSSDMPVVESKLAHAEYIEYYFPEDAPGEGVHDPKYQKGGGANAMAGGRRSGKDPQLDAEGNVWILDRGFPNRLVKLDPRTGEYKEWLTPEPMAGDDNEIIDRKNGILWMAENSGVPEGKMKLRSFNMKTEKWEHAYPLDPQDVIKTKKTAASLTFDSKGNIYVAFIEGGGMGKWNRETKQVSTYMLPTPNSFPYGIVTDKFDSIWIAEFHGSKIAKFDPKTNQFTEYAPPTQPALIRRLNLDSDGQTIWFGLFSAGKLDKLDPTTGKITEWKIPHQISQPYDFVAERGQIWFSDAGQGGALIKFDPKSESFTYFPSPQLADMPKISMSKEGAIWYSPRSSRDHPGLGVLYPDITKITTLAAEHP
jgi:virginiamycin B lyase